MASSEGRRSFLLSITLSELSFILFFLLMIISVATLQKTKQKLIQETQKKTRLQSEISKVRHDFDETFKRLQLLENRLQLAGGFSAKPSEMQLNKLFSKLQEVRTGDDLHQVNAKLQQQLESLQHYKRLSEALEKISARGDSPQQVVKQLLKQTDDYRKEQQMLKGRVAYMQKKLKGNGLDHPPCWIDPRTGTVEYLYSMTLYEHKIKIEAAWPDHRKADVLLIAGAKQLAGQSLTQQRLQQKVQPLFAWSKAHECRHFVRIKDDKQTSKEAFKRQMLAIEAYFYKYLQR